MNLITIQESELVNLKKFQNNINSRNFLIHHDSDFFMIWNLVLSFILIAIVVLLPVEIVDGSMLESQPVQNFINLLFEWFFLVDIVINFITVYQDEQGNLVQQINLITYNYISSWFLIDLVSSVPVENLSLLYSSESTQINLQFVKLVKLPKYIRYINILKKLSDSKMSDYIIDILDFIGAQSIANRYSKIVIYFLIFFIVLHFYSCIFLYLMISNRHFNWFRIMLEDEYNSAQVNPFHQLQELSNRLDYTEFQYNVLEMPSQKYIQAWQQTIQTVTSVGQGDVPSTSISEKVVRMALFFSGVIIWGILSASITELVIFNSIDNLDLNPSRPGKIKQLINQQNLKNESAKILNLLSASVQKQKLKEEFEFIAKLPEYKREVVYKKIYEIFCRKIDMLKDQMEEFFIQFQQLSKFRKCVENEIIINTYQKVRYIQFLWSGRVGVIAPKLDLLFQDYYNVVHQGEDFGYNCFFNNGVSQLKLNCITDCDIVQLNCWEMLRIYKLQGIQNKSNQIMKKLFELMTEMQILLIFNSQMVKNGIYIDMKWFNFVFDQFNVKKFDIITINKSIELLNLSIKKNTLPNLNQSQHDPWQKSQISTETYKQVIERTRNFLFSKISQEKLTSIASKKIMKKFKKGLKDKFSSFITSQPKASANNTKLDPNASNQNPRRASTSRQGGGVRSRRNTTNNFFENNENQNTGANAYDNDDIDRDLMISNSDQESNQSDWSKLSSSIEDKTKKRLAQNTNLNSKKQSGQQVPNVKINDIKKESLKENGNGNESQVHHKNNNIYRNNNTFDDAKSDIEEDQQFDIEDHNNNSFEYFDPDKSIKKFYNEKSIKITKFNSVSSHNSNKSTSSHK